MRITDNNISELITDRNAVHMEYVETELLRCDCFSQILYNFKLTTSFFGDDSEKLAQLLNEHPSYLLIRDDDYHPMTDINCTLFDIKSADYANGKIKFSLTGFRYSNPQSAEKDAKTISGKRFKFMEPQLMIPVSAIYDLVMVKVN